METPLARRIKERIRRDGPMPFHDFMAAALYDLEDGYYAKGPAIGKDGDFTTSVSFSSFRQAIARLVGHAKRALGPDMRVVELGAGTGMLARSILDAHPGLDYVTVDASAGLRAKQAAAGARTVASTRELDPAPSLVFGNEVLDALPVRRVVGHPQGLHEIVVDLDPRLGTFKERLAPLAEPALVARLERLGIAPARGQVLDMAPGLDAFVKDAARLADPGFLVFIDYGDLAGRLYASSNMNGSLAAYKAHGKRFDWYDDVGGRDITADVDWTTVAHAAHDAGMELVGLVTQEKLLLALGIHELGTPDEAWMVAGVTNLGTAFQAFAAKRGVDATLPGF